MGKCDFVMANPPFNVDGVDKGKDSVKTDDRLPFGLPKPDNANYLWIQYFYAYLNPTGRAGFVMASSASDAGHSERDIRQKLVETGAVDVMVSIGTKFFYTRSLPCTLWFFDRAKEQDPVLQDKTLMLDLREVYRKVSSRVHDFTPEHLQNIHAVVGLYRGDEDAFCTAIEEYETERAAGLVDAQSAWQHLMENAALENEDLRLEIKKVAMQTAELKAHKKALSQAHRELTATAKERLKTDELKSDRPRRDRLRQWLDTVAEGVQAFQAAADHALYFDKEHRWLTSRFPDGQYVDLPGLCKVVTREEVAANDYSLTAGRYVGVAPQIDEDFDYEERMAEIKLELAELDREAASLAGTIQGHLNELGV